MDEKYLRLANDRNLLHLFYDEKEIFEKYCARYLVAAAGASILHKELYRHFVAAVEEKKIPPLTSRYFGDCLFQAALNPEMSFYSKRGRGNERTWVNLGLRSTPRVGAIPPEELAPWRSRRKRAWAADAANLVSRL